MEEVSYPSQVQYGVPKAQYLDPYFSHFYMLPFHCYADDTQLYISLQPSETYQIEKLPKGIVHIKKTG